VNQQIQQLRFVNCCIWIRRISPQIWRRLLVRSDSTIAEFHALWAFTPDGRMLITSYCTTPFTCGSAIQLLDVDTLNPVGPPLAVNINYTAEYMQIAPDTNPLYGWSVSDGMVVSWDFSGDSWQTLACQIANRNLTLSEWQQFMGSAPYSKTCSNLPGP